MLLLSYFSKMMTYPFILLASSVGEVTSLFFNSQMIFSAAQIEFPEITEVFSNLFNITEIEAPLLQY